MARPFGCVIDGFTRESLSIRVARKLKATATDVGEKVTRPAVIFAKMAPDDLQTWASSAQRRLSGISDGCYSERRSYKQKLPPRRSLRPIWRRAIRGFPDLLQQGAKLTPENLVCGAAP